MTETTTETAAEYAARWVREHPKVLCRDFAPKPKPAKFWCSNCGWNQTLHADETMRKAIAVELARLTAGGAR